MPCLQLPHSVCSKTHGMRIIIHKQHRMGWGAKSEIRNGAESIETMKKENNIEQRVFSSSYFRLLVRIFCAPPREICCCCCVDVECFSPFARPVRISTMHVRWMYTRIRCISNSFYRFKIDCCSLFYCCMLCTQRRVSKSHLLTHFKYGSYIYF